MRDNRVKLFLVTEDTMMDIIANEVSKSDKFVEIRRLEGLPHDAKVVSVHHDWNTRCWGIMLSHPSFPEVQVGTQVPYADSLLHAVLHTVELPKEQPQRRGPEFL